MKNRKRKDGIAATKKLPSKGHPAYYRYINNDTIEFIPATHSDKVILKKGDYLLSFVESKIIITIPLKNNINPKEHGRVTYVLPFVFVANREMLGKELTKLRVSAEDKKIILELFQKLPRIMITDKSKSRK